MKKPINKKIANRLKELRIKKKFTQEMLAEKSDLPWRTVQKLEASNPVDSRISTLEKIAKGFGISLSEFLKGI